MEKIKFKTNTATIWGGIFFLIVAILFEYAAIVGFRADGRDGIVAIILLTIFLSIPLAFIGIMVILSYFATRKKMRHKLNEYGEDKIISNIEKHTIYTYTGLMGGKTYFTDKLIVDPKAAIIDYNEISYMYLSTITSEAGRANRLGVELWDGTKIVICNGVKGTEIMQMMQLCVQHNPQIMCGHSKENTATQKKRVTDFKNGNKPILHLQLEDDIKTPVMNYSAVEEYVAKNFLPTETLAAIKFYREETGVGLAEAKSSVERIFANRQKEGKVLHTPYEWTPEGEKKDAAKTKMVLGLIIMIVSLALYIMITVISCLIAYNYSITSQDIPSFVAFLIGFFVVFGGLFVIGLRLFKNGKKGKSI